MWVGAWGKGSILRLRAKGVRGEGYKVSRLFRESPIEGPRYPAETFNKGSFTRDQNELKMWRSTRGSPPIMGVPGDCRSLGLVVTTELLPWCRNQ